jgi:gas vesicle protein
MARPGRGPRRGGAAVSHDEDLDLLTAALIGLTVGVGVTMLFRRRAPARGSFSRGMDEMADRGARIASLAGAAGAGLAKKASRGARRGMEWAEDLSVDGVGEQLHDYFEAAKGAIEDTVSGELQDLRKSIRRRRQRLGI